MTKTAFGFLHYVRPDAITIGCCHCHEGKGVSAAQSHSIGIVQLMRLSYMKRRSNYKRLASRVILHDDLINRPPIPLSLIH